MTNPLESAWWWIMLFNGAAFLAAGLFLDKPVAAVCGGVLAMIQLVRWRWSRWTRERAMKRERRAT